VCYIDKFSKHLAYNSQLHNYNTRGKNDLHIQACNTALYQKSIINSGTKLLEKLANGIRGLKTLMQFKREVKLLLRQMFPILLMNIYIQHYYSIVYWLNTWKYSNVNKIVVSKHFDFIMWFITL
jgi:hypothetical protein